MQITPTTSTGGTPVEPGESRVPLKVLGQQDFLKLLATQMTSQDPLNPQADTQFIAQMAQFSALENSKSMQDELAQMRADQNLMHANSLLGKTVALQVDEDITAEGTVSAVQIEAGTPKLIVNGQEYELSQVLTITPSLGESTTPTLQNYARISQLGR